MTPLQLDLLRMADRAEKGVSLATYGEAFGDDHEPDEIKDALDSLVDDGLLSYWATRGYWSITEDGEGWRDENDPAEYLKEYDCSACDGETFEVRPGTHPEYCPMCGEWGRISCCGGRWAEV